MSDHDKAQLLTTYIHNTYPETPWTYETSLSVIIKAKEFFNYLDTGSGVGINIIGDTILVEGRDITGTLGAKTTYGPNSPIGDVSNSYNGGSGTLGNALVIAVVTTVLAFIGRYAWQKYKDRRKQHPPISPL